MQRVIIRRALVLAAITLWLSTNAVAFTLRVGSIPADEVLLGTLTTDVPDLPTPAFFRFVLRPNGITLGLQQPFGHDPRLRLTPRFEVAPPLPPSPIVSRPSQQPSIDRFHLLRGVETRLLRQTPLVIADQEQ